MSMHASIDGLTFAVGQEGPEWSRDLNSHGQLTKEISISFVELLDWQRSHQILIT